MIKVSSGWFLLRRGISFISVEVRKPPPTVKGIPKAGGGPGPAVKGNPRGLSRGRGAKVNTDVRLKEGNGPEAQLLNQAAILLVTVAQFQTRLSMLLPRI